MSNWFKNYQSNHTIFNLNGKRIGLNTIHVPCGDPIKNKDGTISQGFRFYEKETKRFIDYNTGEVMDNTFDDDYEKYDLREKWG